MNYISEHVIWCVNAVSLHKLRSSVLDDISNVSLVLSKVSVSVLLFKSLCSRVTESIANTSIKKDIMVYFRLKAHMDTEIRDHVVYSNWQLG